MVSRTMPPKNAKESRRGVGALLGKEEIKCNDFPNQEERRILVKFRRVEEDWGGWMFLIPCSLNMHSLDILVLRLTYGRSTIVQPTRGRGGGPQKSTPE